MHKGINSRIYLVIPCLFLVQASLAANTFAITGHVENKQLTEMLPGILNQLGTEGLSNLRKLAERLPHGRMDTPIENDDVAGDDDVPGKWILFVC